MSSEQTLRWPGGNTVGPAQQDQRRQLRSALLALALPAFFVLGLALAYMSAYQAPAPHGVQVAVAGPAAQTAPLRDSLERTAGPAFNVQAVPTPSAAARAVGDHDLYGAYVPAAQPGATATVIVADASGSGVTNAVESLFRAVAVQQRAQLAVRDVRPLPTGNTSGLSMMFYLFACTFGGVLAVAATGMVAPGLRARYRWPLLLTASVAVPIVAYLLAGQGLGAISGSAGAVFALLGVSVLYVLIVTIIVRCLQLILGAIGALFTAMTVFIMLNFPSSGVSVQAPMLPTFWHVLNRFWIGAAASDAFRSIFYFGGQGVGTDVLKLLGWLAVGAVLLALVTLPRLQHERQRHEVAPVERPAERPAGQLRIGPTRGLQPPYRGGSAAAERYLSTASGGGSMARTRSRRYAARSSLRSWPPRSRPGRSPRPAAAAVAPAPAARRWRAARRRHPAMRRRAPSSRVSCETCSSPAVSGAVRLAGR
jgi:hypothetical protein